jgi:hypothetical protein
MDATRLEAAGTRSAAELGTHPPKGTPLPVRFASPYHPTRSVHAVCNGSEIGSRQHPPHLAPRRARRSRHGCQVRVQFGDTRCEGTKLPSTLVLRFRTYPHFRATRDTSAISVDCPDLIVNKTLNSDSRVRKPGLHRHPPTGDWFWYYSRSSSLIFFFQLP